MSLWIRSFVFNLFFYGWTFLYSFFCLPVLFFPHEWALRVARFWVKSIFWGCEKIIGLRVCVRGTEKLSIHPAIFAAKHQSTWETITFHSFLDDPSIILKRELLWIPIFGWYLKKFHMIPLSRSKNKKIQDLKILLRDAEYAISQGQSLLIFPEGTRAKPGKKSTYHSGVASLYQSLKIPVIPIAHNAGLFWPRRGFLKYPGEIILDVLDPIQPGLPRKEFMGILENNIESATNALLEKEKHRVFQK